MFIFRTEASEKIGFHNLIRSITLASLLKKKTEIIFCVNENKVLLRFLESKKFSCVLFKDIDNLKDRKIKSIVFDLGSFSNKDLQLIKWAKINKINSIQITDFGLNQQEVDCIIDVSIKKLSPYRSKKNLLNGPDYTILHNKYRHFNKVKRKYRKNVKNIFVCLGGTVEYRRLRKVIDYISRSQFKIKIAPGFYIKKSKKKILKRIYPKIRFVGKTESLARSFFESDIALITPGHIAFEAASTGTPSLYLYFNKEQEFSASSLKEKGVGEKFLNIDKLSIHNAIKEINLLSMEQRINMGNRGKKLVDAMGVYRIIDFLKNKGII